MDMKDDLQAIIAKKQAGVKRMLSRQRLVHSRMASMVESRPEVIDEALSKVKQRLQNSGEATREIYLEWYQILTTWSADRIACMLRDKKNSNDQLRACAPFDFAMS